ncbi:MAG: hydroxymethylglutaryl-CoA reductase, degradative [Bacteroidales bacterium]|nr:hydroxymethylglutaryl-CoA reductase, degradative [Bacteroidales bacterium]
MIEGFSKLSKSERRKKLVEMQVISENLLNRMEAFDIESGSQKMLDNISENTLANYFLPLGIVPNVYINGQQYWVPMVTEESSVVAAASYASKFWSTRGGFRTKIIGTTKVGQIHFFWEGNSAILESYWEELKKLLLESVEYLSENMKKRGGGVLDIEYSDYTHLIRHYHRIQVYFETADAMGANYINSCLETMAKELPAFFEEHFTDRLADCEVNMAILSNYTPQCLVECSVECPVDELEPISAGLGSKKFAEKFSQAIAIAQVDPYRAVTHNKGIFNGIDAVVLATGNDFRAIEAGGHAYAARGGTYTSLSKCEIYTGRFRFTLQVPLALGTVGGLTRAHPMAATALEILGNPTAPALMQIAAAMGMANHFAAIRALVTTGIQKGHMKMHLTKILNHLNASQTESELASHHFKNHDISYKAVAEFLQQLRSNRQV